MSDGDAKESVNLSEKEYLQAKRKIKKSGIDEFSQAIARIAVAQVCESLGYQGVQESALDTLADVGVRYIREVGRRANFYANLANRSQCNVLDVIQGLEDLGSVEGFSGASNVGHSLSESGVVGDIIHYVGQAEEIPFAYLIPSFPIVKERRLNPSFAQAEENPPNEHIPCWLRNFPDPETYVDLDSGDKKDAGTWVENKIQPVQEQHRKVKRSLLDVQQKLVCNGSEAEVAVEQGDAAKARPAAESNPFLAPPLQFGEKEVSLPLLPAKFLNEVTGHNQSREVVENKVSIFEPSMPAIKAVRSGPCEPEDMTKILLNGRPNVHFKFGNSKKSLGTTMNPWNKDVEKISPWFVTDHDGKDEKKKKAKQILWENIENPQEVSHL